MINFKNLIIIFSISALSLNAANFDNKIITDCND